MKEDTNKVNVYSSISKSLLYKDAKRALLYSDTFMALAKKLNYTRGILRANVLKSIYFRNNSEFEKAFTHLFDAIKIAEQLNDKKNLAMCYNNLGITYKNQGKYPEAVGSLKEAQKYYRQLNDLDGVATAFGNMSNAYRRNKQYELAIQSSMESLRIQEQIKNIEGQRAALGGIATVYLDDKKNYQKALGYFLRMRKLSDPNDPGTISIIDLNMGICYMYLKQLRKAEEFVLNSVREGATLQNRQQRNDQYVTLAEIYEEMGDTKQALFYYKRFHDLGDSLVKDTYEKSNLELQEKFQSEKSKKEIELLSVMNNMKDKENEVQKSQLRTNQLINIAGTVVAIIISCLAILFYKNYKKGQRLNDMLTGKNAQIESQKKEILDSILYARRIQDSILPQHEELLNCFPNHFVIYRPRDIVSGDFYWTYHVPKTGPEQTPLSILALCDCTGHGVPGAFMSLISYTLLNQIVKDTRTDSANTVLDFLARELPIALKSGGQAGSLRDGLDIAVAAIDFNAMTMQCSMAHIPVYICDGKELRFIKPDKHSISADNYDPDFKFSIHRIQLKKGDRIYFSTDGFADQFGGSKGKKLKYKELENLLFSTHGLPLQQQKKELEDFFLKWRGQLEQVDDVTLIGIEI